MEVDDGEQWRLKELALEERAFDAEKRFLWEGDCAFGDGVEIACELEVAEVVEKGRFEEWLAIVARESGQVGAVGFVEAEVLEKFDGGG